jgi:hypothetical protein
MCGKKIKDAMRRSIGSNIRAQGYKSIRYKGI